MGLSKQTRGNSSGIEPAIGVVAHHPTRHDENAQGVRLLNELPQGFCPSRRLSTLLDVETQSVSHKGPR